LRIKSTSSSVFFGGFLELIQEILLNLFVVNTPPLRRDQESKKKALPTMHCQVIVRIAILRPVRFGGLGNPKPLPSIPIGGLAVGAATHQLTVSSNANKSQRLSQCATVGGNELFDLYASEQTRR
jgi:hypothetical protein